MQLPLSSLFPFTMPPAVPDPSPHWLHIWEMPDPPLSFLSRERIREIGILGARLLDRTEQTRAAAMHMPARVFFIYRHLLIHALLACYASAAPEEVRITYGSGGKPFFGPVPFSVTGITERDPAQRDPVLRTRTFLAVTDYRTVGLDAGHVGQDAALVPEVFCTGEECRSLPGCPSGLPGDDAGERSRALMTLWIRKEAVCKATGEGIVHGLKQIEASWEQDSHRVRRYPDGLTCLSGLSDCADAQGRPFSSWICPVLEDGPLLLSFALSQEDLAARGTRAFLFRKMVPVCDGTFPEDPGDTEETEDSGATAATDICSVRCFSLRTAPGASPEASEGCTGFSPSLCRSGDRLVPVQWDL